MKGNELELWIANMGLYHNREVTVESKSSTNIAQCQQISIKRKPTFKRTL